VVGERYARSGLWSEQSLVCPAPLILDHLIAHPVRAGQGKARIISILPRDDDARGTVN